MKSFMKGARTGTKHTQLADRSNVSAATGIPVDGRNLTFDERQRMLMTCFPGDTLIQILQQTDGVAREPMAQQQLAPSAFDQSHYAGCQNCYVQSMVHPNESAVSAFGPPDPTPTSSVIFVVFAPASIAGGGAFTARPASIAGGGAFTARPQEAYHSLMNPVGRAETIHGSIVGSSEWQGPLSQAEAISAQGQVPHRQPDFSNFTGAQSSAAPMSAQGQVPHRQPDFSNFTGAQSFVAPIPLRPVASQATLNWLEQQETLGSQSQNGGSQTGL
jgi:hypothetical protein